MVERAGIMKKIRSQTQSARNIQGKGKSSEAKGKIFKKKSKMRRKMFSKAKGETSESLKKDLLTIKKELPTEADKSNIEYTKIKPVVTNVKHVKEQVSSNWAAFKANGFHKIQPKPKPKSDSNFEGIFRKKWKKLKKGDHSVTNPDEATENSESTVECIDIEDSYTKNLVPTDEKSIKELTKCIAIDCEMVGVGDGKESALARVSLVNQHGACLYDKFVKTKEDVTDYRTKVSGVRPGDLALGEDLETVQKDVAKIVQGRILVGHAISHDLKVLFLSHPPHLIRDTSKFKPFRDMFDGRIPALRKLSEKILGVKIQEGEHSSVQDAKATMQLYNLYQKEWEEYRKKIHLQSKEKLKKNAKRQMKSQDSLDNSEDELDQDANPHRTLNKHRKLHMKRKDKMGSQKPAAPVSTMPDEYVAF